MKAMLAPMALMPVTGGIAVLIYYARRHYLASKMVMDFVLGLIALIAALPVMAVCATIIKLSSRGPVLFSQVRVGKDGGLFRMWKFRTMYADAEQDSGPVWADDNDPRVIPACRWMRISHMDELPQLLHVVAGTMSLVGPRPERPEILAELEAHYPNVRDRLTVRPGITGLAQVRNGYDRSVESFRHKLETDLEYIENLGWAQDLKILTLTAAMIYDRKAR